MAMKIDRGRKYSSPEAKAMVDGLYAKVRERWEARVNQKPFMQQLMAGKLPFNTLKIFSATGERTPSKLTLSPPAPIIRTSRS
jgi:hypothetical protein